VATDHRTHTTLRDDVFPPVPQGVFGVCEGCGAVAWELLSGLSPLCLGCAPWDYRHDDEYDDEDEWDD
jgi:hypothetical protein